MLIVLIATSSIETFCGLCQQFLTLYYSENTCAAIQGWNWVCMGHLLVYTVFCKALGQLYDSCQSLKANWWLLKWAFSVLVSKLYGFCVYCVHRIYRMFAPSLHIPHSYLHWLASCCCSLWCCSCTHIMVNLQVQWHRWAEHDSWRQQWQEADRRRHM